MTPMPAPGTPCRPISRTDWQRFWGKSPEICRSTGKSQYQTVKRGQGQIALALSELEDCVPDRQDVESQMEEHRLVACIEAFLDALPRLKRQVFVRRYWYLTPVGRLRAQNGMSESRVTSMLFRLRKDLKTQLEQEGIWL